MFWKFVTLIYSIFPIPRASKILPHKMIFGWYTYIFYYNLFCKNILETSRATKKHNFGLDDLGFLFLYPKFSSFYVDLFLQVTLSSFSFPFIFCELHERPFGNCGMKGRGQILCVEIYIYYIYLIYTYKI